MKLSQLLKRSGINYPILTDPDILGLATDSRQVKSGDLFFAIPGVHTDGHHYLDQANSRGAVAAVVEKSVVGSLPTIHVPRLAPAMSVIANQFFGEPSKKIPVVGITGTNGKTTTTYLIEDVFKTLGKKTGVMGTINYRLGAVSQPAPNTTPLSVDVHRFLAEAVQQQADVVAMEVSSHALELNRVDTVAFSVGVFSNLTQDHLDFHKDMESYFKAKARLFREFPGIKSVVNINDSFGYRLAVETNTPFTYGFDSTAAIQALHPIMNLKGLQFDMRLPSGKVYSVTTNLMGRHNILNLLSAAGALLALGYSESDVAQGLNGPHAVPGRLERVEAGQDFVVVVDYAHTEDALLQVLRTLRDTQPHRLITVFGAGGDRDKTKRPKMGKAAAQLSDHVILTSDNPRSENPRDILNDIEAGIKEMGKTNYDIHEDRAMAIHHALRLAQTNDIILIAGKGHETYQIYGTEKIHFSDQETALQGLIKK